MKRLMIGLVAAPVLVAAGVVLAQDGRRGMNPFPEPHGMPRHLARLSAEDRQAFADARIAALHAGLKLTPEQEKLWPPFEQAIRDFAKQRMEARALLRERFAAMREEPVRDLPGQLRFMSERLSSSSASLARLADASGPLYGSLDEAQKRRMSVMTRFMRGWMAPGMMAGRGPGPDGDREGR